MGQVQGEDKYFKSSPTQEQNRDSDAAFGVIAFPTNFYSLWFPIMFSTTSAVCFCLLSAYHCGSSLFVIWFIILVLGQTWFLGMFLVQDCKSRGVKYLDNSPLAKPRPP